MKAKYKELSDIAYNLQKQNKLDEALEIYNLLLKMNSEDVNVLNLVGMLYMAKKQYSESINYLSKAVVLNKSAYILSNLGKAYYLNEQYAESIDLYLQALQVEENDDILYSLALAYKTVQKFDLAIKYYQKAILNNSENYNALYNLALLYKDLNNSEMALDYCLKAMHIVPDDVDLYTLLSKLYENLHDYNKSIKYLEKAVSLTPNNSLFYYNLGVLYSKIGDNENALNNYLIVLNLQPNDTEAMINISNLYKENDKEKALKYALRAFDLKSNDSIVNLLLSQIYREMYDYDNSLNVLNNYLNIDSNNPEIYYQFALNYMDLGLYNDALINYEKALSFDKENLSYLKGKAIAYKYLGEEKLAINLLNEIYQKDGNSNSTAISLGMCYLKNRDFYNGMELYSKRSYDSKLVKLFTDKIWNKSVDFFNKKVLLYSDCGLGDTIMFARYLPMLKNLVSSLTLQTDTEIVELLKLSYPEINIISKSDEKPEYDIVMPIMDISYALNSDFSQIPNKDCYLKTDVNKVEEFSKSPIFNNSKLKVGICYQGNKRVLKNRSISFDKIKELFSINNCEFYSFQLNDKIDSIVNLSDYIKNYSDTASLLKCIDVLVTIDSSIVHVAGALGVKTFLMLPNTPEWRWFNDSVKSSWYDSVQIFKQKSINDWDSVICSVKEELIKYADK